MRPLDPSARPPVEAESIVFPAGDLPDHRQTVGERWEMPDEAGRMVLERTTPGPAWWRLLRELAGDERALNAVRSSIRTRRIPNRADRMRYLATRATRYILRHRLPDEAWAGLAWRAGISPVRYLTELFRRAGIESEPETWPMRKTLLGNRTNRETGARTYFYQVLPSWGQIVSQALVHAAINRPEIVRQHLGTEEKIRLYCDRVWKGVERDDPEAMKLFPKLLGLIGGGQEVDEAIKRLLGVKNLVEAVRKLQIADEAERVGSDEDAEREALRWINERRRMRGEVPYPDVYPAHEAEVVG